VKAWRSRLAQHLATWSAKLPTYRSWWPKYVYHFTNVANAVRIVQAGFLFSREEARRRELMVTDNASAAVIQGTSQEHLKLARMYFRPRTPTQYHNEGIRPRAQRTMLNAHCAMPVFFFFDFVSVLAADETLFSDGNIASGRASISSNEDFFSSIPFEDVYSDGGMGTRVAELTFRRQAEILAPGSLPLGPHLKMVCCRSSGERQTLLHLLQSSDTRLRSAWEPLVRVATDPIFERRATFVETVSAVGEVVRFTFNPASRFNGPFFLDLRVDAGRTWHLQAPHVTLGAEYSVRLPGIGATAAVLQLHLDGDLAFQGLVTFGSAAPY
jgi:hypothetical protein